MDKTFPLKRFTIDFLTEKHIFSLFQQRFVLPKIELFFWIKIFNDCCEKKHKIANVHAYQDLFLQRGLFSLIIYLIHFKCCQCRNLLLLCWNDVRSGLFASFINTSISNVHSYRTQVNFNTELLPISKNNFSHEN